MPIVLSGDGLNGDENRYHQVGAPHIFSRVLSAAFTAGAVTRNASLHMRILGRLVVVL